MNIHTMMQYERERLERLTTTFDIDYYSCSVGRFDRIDYLGNSGVDYIATIFCLRCNDFQGFGTTPAEAVDALIQEVGNKMKGNE